MTDALDPSVALAYLLELSADVRAGLVVGHDGERLLTGEAALLAPARALLAAAPRVGEVEVALVTGRAFAARDERRAVVLACGPFALPGLVGHDVRGVLAQMAGECPSAAAPPPVPAGRRAGPRRPWSALGRRRALALPRVVVREPANAAARSASEPAAAALVAAASALLAAAPVSG